ncbi:phage tail tape measure protein [Polymorphospora rubra]|uniref:Phage tail tape measure protein domain-containing protein n=1 Tax=Polymorphospora rubra TaxID=338584 RepID=A0A810MXP5_9ACTN|nr:phage tail tape measure protein [Polymorphospora rubra]BCJ64155.1 hypothetical protein Prubr_11760 [Polymorphospora rubra]
MSLHLGTLNTQITADSTQFERGLDQSESRFERFGGRLKAGAAIVGAAVGAVLASSIGQALELDKAQTLLTAQLGDPVEAKRLGDIAGRVYGRGFTENAGEAMQAARAVMQSGLLPPNADAATIEDLTVKAQGLATVFGQDVTQATRAAGQMVKTGLAKDAGEAMDLITRGFQVTGDQAGDLLDSFSEYGTQFRKLGLSGADAMGLMNQGVKAGARDLDTVADALKEFSIRAIDGSKATAEAFQALGMDAEGMAIDLASGAKRRRPRSAWSSPS